MYYSLINSMNRAAAAPSYPTSLKLFIDAGNPLSYSGSGTTVTDLIGTQNGTLTNGVSYSSSNGGFFAFNGTNQFITFGTNTNIQPTTSRTISIWYKAIAYSGILFSDGNYNAGTNGFIHELSSKRSITMNGANYSLENWGGTWNINTWYYITVKWLGSSLYIYQNGNLISSHTPTYMPTNGVNPTILGASSSSGTANNFSNIHVSQMKIYNASLSDAEILADFNEFKSRYGY